MKKFPFLLSVIIAASFMMQSCVKDSLTSTYTYYVPVYKTKAEVLRNIKSNSPQPLQQTGKLFLYGKYIFVNEINKGVHIIDNTNPRSPKNISFISIPGNLDIAVKNNSLYADLYTDMVTLDISNPADISLKKVSNRVFAEREYNTSFAADSTKYIIDWLKQQTTDKKDLENKVMLPPVFFFASSSQSNSSGSGAVVGVGGSMARFAVVNNYLYTVGQSSLTAFNISLPMNPVSEHEQRLGWNIETIYPLKDKLFIGSQTGMYIFSITDPASPEYIGIFQHACFNDPVIADDEYAYVTLRAIGSASSCWGTTAQQRNELDIVNISNLLMPSLIKVYDMAEPKGLSKDGNYLFICDGKEGLKIFDATNVQDLKRLKTINDINPFDVVCQSGLAIVVANEGIYQYDYSDINNVKLISKIVVEKQ